MSTESKSVMRVSLKTVMSPNLYRADEPRAHKPEPTPAPFLDTIVGRHGRLRSILVQLKTVAPTNATVLIIGESGTGKAVIARALHEVSPRRNRNLVKVKCEAIPVGLLDSELFGHVREAFAGAITSHTGRFTLADRATLFLDETAEMPQEAMGAIVSHSWPGNIRELQNQVERGSSFRRGLSFAGKPPRRTHRRMLWPSLG